MSPNNDRSKEFMEDQIMDEATMNMFYRFLVTLFHQSPCPYQLASIEQAEELYQHTQGWRKPQMTEEDRRQASANMLRHYAELSQFFPQFKACWQGGQTTWTSADQPKLDLAVGLPRTFVLEIQNKDEAPLHLRMAPDAEVMFPFVPDWIPPGQTRPLVVATAQYAEGQQEIGLSFLAGLSPTDLKAVQLPLTCQTSLPATVTGTIIDSDRNKPWPGRVFALGSDGLHRFDTKYQDNSTLYEKPVIFRPATHRYPFFYSDGQFQVMLPPGHTTLVLERGCEHPLVRKEMELAPGETRTVVLSSGRMVDMKAQGWVSGDTHVHWAKNCWNINEDLELLAMVQRAEDVRVVNNLLLYQYLPEGPFIKPDQAPMGPVEGFCDNEYHVQMAEEYRNDNWYGHINLLGIKEVVQPIATGPGSGGPPDALDWPHNTKAIHETLEQGGLVTEAHGLGPFVRGDCPINVINGLTEVLDQMDTEFYYRFLDCGFRIPLGNGSDHPARVLGCARVYVKIDGEFTYDGWLDGMRHDRTFTTSGPLIFLTVNGEEIGSKLTLDAGTPLQIHARVVSRYPVGKLQVLTNGGKILESLETDSHQAEIKLTLNADESSWFVARCSQNDVFAPIHTAEDYHTAHGHIAHTSAIYVDVGGKPAFRPKAAEEWIDLMRLHAKEIGERANFADDQQRQVAVQYVLDGIKKYEDLIQTYQA